MAKIVRRAAVRQRASKQPAFNRRHFGPIAFWCLNHLLEPDELARQIDELKAQGFSGFFMHPRAGLLTPYGSKDWFDAIGFCIRHAKSRGLEAWLYDEDPYPSGMAGGRVTMGNPQWLASFLEPSIQSITQPGRHHMDLPPGPLVGAYLVTNGKVRRIDDSAGLLRTEWKAIRLVSHSYYPPFATQGSPHWRASTVRPHYRVTIDVDAPATLVAFTRQHHTLEPYNEFPDLMNPAAVASFIDLTHKQYQSRFGKHFGDDRAVPGIFTDEPKVLGSFPWSDALHDVFHTITGKPIADVMPHLVLDIDDRSLYFRWAYREAISRAFKTAFIDQLTAYCRQANLISTGHISPEEDPIGQAVFTPGLMDWIGALDIPGVDLIGAEIGDVRHKLFHLGPKLVSSAAHTRGKTHVLCEAFAVVDWVQDTAWMGKAVNWLYVLGVNMLTPHGQFYSIDGPRKREAPPSQFVQASYWEHFGAVSRYVETLSRELTAGKHAAPVALYYPSEAFLALSPASTYDKAFSKHAAAEASRLRDLLAEVIDRLLTAGFDFDLIDAQALVTAKVVDGKLRIHGETYDALVAPGGYLREDAAGAMRSFEKRGLPVLSLEKQTPILGAGSYRARRTCNVTSLRRAISGHCRPIFTAAGRLIGHKRTSPDGERLFLVNNADTAFRGKVVPDFAGPYDILDLHAGRSFHAGDALHLEIEPGRGILIRRAAASRPSVAYRNLSDWKPWLDLTADWTCRPESDNCLILSEFRIRPQAMTSDTTDAQFLAAPFIDLLSPSAPNATAQLGRVTCFWTSFDARNLAGPLHLVRDSQLGPPSDRQQSDNFRFFVNGRQVSRFHRTRRYDTRNLEASIDHLIHEGRNFLVMEQTLPADWPLDKGMPYDCLRLFGRFHVEMPFGRSCPALLTPRPDSYSLGTPQPVQRLGHPHFGGIAVYSRQVEFSEIPGRLALQFETLHESAEIRVNGKPAGILWQPPHHLEMEPSLWKRGINTLEIRCSTSPANYLQGLMRPSGFTGRVSLQR